MIYLMVATIKENIRRRGLNLGSEKTGFNQCLDQNMKEGLNKVQSLRSPQIASFTPPSLICSVYQPINTFRPPRFPERI
jgi:hypothetical protein